MSLPFTPDQFLDVLARFNAVIWPVEVVLWLLSAAAIAAVAIIPGARTTRAAATVLVLLWASGVVYHAGYFTAINPAAWWFALLFLVQAGLLVWAGLVTRRVSFGSAPRPARGLGVAVAAYGLAYPAITWLLGHGYPRMPVFAVPCPTTLVTAGLLLTCAAPPRAVLIAPVLWGLVGGSAAILLGVPADYALFAAALALAALAMTPRHHVDAPGGTA